MDCLVILTILTFFSEKNITAINAVMSCHTSLLPCFVVVEETERESNDNNYQVEGSLLGKNKIDRN